MQFLTLYTPDRPSSQPAAEHMATMNAMTNRMLDSGELLLAGALGRREKVGMRVALQDGKYTVTEAPAGESVLLSAGGVSINQAETVEDFVRQAKEFLAAAGDGTVDVIGFAFPAMTKLGSNGAAPGAVRPESAGVIPAFSVEGAAAAAEFYKKAFGATEIRRAPADDGKRLLHCNLVINGGSIMINDPFPERGYPFQASSNFTMTLVVADGDAWWKRAIDAGCTVTMPFERQFWGDRYGQLKDPFQINWALDEPATGDA